MTYLDRARERTFKVVVAIAFATAWVTVFGACQPSSRPLAQVSVQESPSSIATADAASPSLDGAGHDGAVLRQSSLEDVELVVDREWADLPKSFTGDSIALKPFFELRESGGYQLSEFSRVIATTADSKRLVEIALEFLAGGITKQPQRLFAVARVESILPFVKLEKLRDKSCHESDKNHLDGSAREKTICISLGRLTRISPSALKNEVSALLAHEFMHVLGYAESDARLMQRYILVASSSAQIERLSWLLVNFRAQKDNARMVFQNFEILDPTEGSRYSVTRAKTGAAFFYNNLTKSLMGDEKRAIWEPRFAEQRDRIARLEAEFLSLMINGDPMHSKATAFQGLIEAWTAAEMLTVEFMPMKLDAQPEGETLLIAN